MAKVEIYTTTYCPFCIQAKMLLKSKQIAFEETDLNDKPDELQALKERTGWPTVPQIFIDGKLIGGFNELRQLDQSGELDKLTAS